MLGGAAVHFALAASFFEDVRVVGPVGDDFGEASSTVMRRRGVDVSDVERVAGGQDLLLAAASTDGTSTRARRSTRSSACSRDSSRS